MKKLIIILSAIVIVVDGYGQVGEKRPMSDTQTRGVVKLLETMTHGNGSSVRFEYDDKNRIAKMSHYDSRGNLSRIQTFTYNEGDTIVTITSISENHPLRDGEKTRQTSSHLVKNGDTITSHSHTIVSKDLYITEITIVDKDGFTTWRKIPPRMWSDGTTTEVRTYHYQNGNLTEIRGVTKYDSERHSIWRTELKYDNKKSPLFYCKTPRWLLQSFLFSERFGLNNNIIEWNTIIESNPVDVIKWPEHYAFNYEYDSDGFPIKRTLVQTTADNRTITVITHFTYQSQTKKP